MTYNYNINGHQNEIPDFNKLNVNFAKLDHYSLLGVHKNATKDEIHKAFRQKSRLFHSDKTHGDDELMKTLNNAKMTLIDPEKKAEYDRNYDPEEFDVPEWDKIFLNNGERASKVFMDNINAWINEFDSLKFNDNSNFIQTKLDEIKMQFDRICQEANEVIEVFKKNKFHQFLNYEERIKLSFDDVLKKFLDTNVWELHGLNTNGLWYNLGNILD